MSHSNDWRRLGVCSILALLGACADETVDLGSGPMSTDNPRGARCAESTIANESVHIENQAQLEDLAGCEEIAGNLEIEVFAGADLSPLASLRAVDGTLSLGALSIVARRYDLSPDEIAALNLKNAERERIVDEGYLPTLKGLESLERIAALSAYGIAAEDLAPLLTLRKLTRGDLDSATGVNIERSRLRSLHGLENIEIIADLRLSQNPELESLSNIVLYEGANVYLFDEPKLTRVPELAPIVYTSSLTIKNVGIANLDDLANLTQADILIFIKDNPNLLDVERLEGVRTKQLLIDGNARLRSVPPVRLMTSLDWLSVINNPELESVTLELPTLAPYDSAQGIEFPPGAIRAIDIGRNAKLRNVSLADGLQRARILAIYENPSLQSLSFGTINGIEELHIQNNDRLASIDVGALDTVDKLTVIANPSLDTSSLATVRTFETTMTGNIGDPIAAP